MPGTSIETTKESELTRMASAMALREKSSTIAIAQEVVASIATYKDKAQAAGIDIYKREPNPRDSAIENIAMLTDLRSTVKPAFERIPGLSLSWQGSYVIKEPIEDWDWSGEGAEQVWFTRYEDRLITEHALRYGLNDQGTLGLWYPDYSPRSAIRKYLGMKEDTPIQVSLTKTAIEQNALHLPTHSIQKLGEDNRGTILDQLTTVINLHTIRV